MALLLLLLSLAPEAAAAQLVRCEARLALPVGEVAVVGFGTDTATSRARARRAASALAAHHASAELLTGLIADPAAALGRQLRWLQLASGVEGPAIGYTVADGACTSDPLPRNRDAAWSATWAGGRDEVLRNDPGLAAEGARRRTCYGAYQSDVQRILAQGGAAPDRDRWRVLVTGVGDARDHLVRCVTEGAADLGPARAPLPGADGSGLFACHRPRRVGDAWTATPGWGPSLEEAREAALARDLLVVSRQVTGDALSALQRGPNGLPSRLSEAVGPLRTLVVSSDVVEQATLLCAAGPPAAARYAWTPPERCGTPEAPVELTVGASALEELAGSRCDAVLASGAAATGRLLKGSRSDDGLLAAAGLGTALTCAASCSRDISLQGWLPSPVGRPGELPRGDGDAAAKALTRALERRDLEAFGVLTGGVMLDPRFAGTAREDPEGFWGSLDEARRTGRLAETAAWEQVEGHWLLTFR